MEKDIERSSAKYQLPQSNVSTLAKSRELSNLQVIDVVESADISVVSSNHPRSGNIQIEKQSIGEAPLSNSQVASPIIIFLNESDIQYVVGDIEVLSWNIEDENNNGKNYSFYLNDDKVNQDIIWTENLTVHFDLLTNITASGMYNVTLLAFDQTENFGRNVVTFVGTQRPEITQLNATTIQYEVGEIATLNWNLKDSDGDGKNYSFYLDDVKVNTDVTWTDNLNISFALSTNITAHGTYNVTVLAYDQVGNSNRSTIFINAREAPKITFQGGGQDYIIGTDVTLNWDIVDVDGKNYSIIIDDVIIKAGISWTTNFVLQVNLLTNITRNGKHTITIVAYDQTEKSDTNIVHVSATDILKPTKNESLSTQSPLVVEHLSTGQSFVWVYLDESGGGNYTLFIDDVRERDNQTWVSGIAISYIDTSLVKSGVNYTLVIGDYSGNSVKDSAIVNIVQQQNPEVVFLSSREYNISNSNVTIFWSITDLSPGTIAVYVDGMLSPNQEFTSTRSEVLNLSSIAIYNYTIIATDELGNTNRTEYFITVFDKQAPDVVSMPLVYIPLGSSTGRVINWTVSDTNPDSFGLTNDFSQAPVNGTWSNNQTVQFTISTELPLGIYNVSLYINDTLGNSANILIQIVIFDSTVPPITTNGNQSGQLGLTTGIELIFTVHDPRSKSYNLTSSWNNLSVSGNWNTPTDSLTIQLDNTIPFGTHIYNLTNYLRNGAISFSIIQIIIIDEFIPQFLVTATNQTFEYSNGQRFEFLWTISDTNPYLFHLTNNGSLPQILNEDWSAVDIEIRYNQSLIEPGVVEFTLIIIDTAMNTNEMKVFLKVTDTTLPVFLTIPMNQTVEQTTQDTIQLTWSALDELNGTYTIEDEQGQIVATGNWTHDDSIDFQIEASAPGNYQYTIFVSDHQGNSINHTVSVIIVDQEKPETRSLIYPGENLEAGSSESFVITINATDKNPHEYYLERTVVGSRFLTSGTWTSGIPTTITLDQIGLGINTFNFTLLDKFGNSKTELFTIIGEDTGVPIITKPADMSFELGTTEGNALNWSVIDFNPDKFVIHRNNVKVSTGNWKSNSTISYTFPELTVGNHIFNFTVTDQAGHSSSALTEVRISDTVKPVFTFTPTNPMIKEIDPTKILTWTVEDLDPATYSIQINGTKVSEGQWTSGQPIVLSLDNLTIGTFEIVIFAVDASNNEATYTVIFTINPTSSQISENIGIVIFRVFAILIALGIVAVFTTLFFFNHRGIDTKEKISELLQETKTRMQPAMNRMSSAREKVKMKERMSSAREKAKSSMNRTQSYISSQKDKLSKKKKE